MFITTELQIWLCIENPKGYSQFLGLPLLFSDIGLQLVLLRMRPGFISGTNFTMWWTVVNSGSSQKVTNISSWYYLLQTGNPPDGNLIGTTRYQIPAFQGQHSDFSSWRPFVLCEAERRQKHEAAMGTSAEAKARSFWMPITFASPIFSVLVKHSWRPWSPQTLFNLALRLGRLSLSPRSSRYTSSASLRWPCSKSKAPNACRVGCNQGGGSE